MARRIAYFASDEDLEEGEAPVTLESVMGFWEFFNQVESQGKLDLACSPEGCMSAVWRFPDDERRACVWFFGDNRVTFSATDAAGNFIRIADDGGRHTPNAVMEKLVQSGLLTWYSDKTSGSTSRQSITWRDTVAGDG